MEILLYFWRTRPDSSTIPQARIYVFVERETTRRVFRNCELKVGERETAPCDCKLCHVLDEVDLALSRVKGVGPNKQLLRLTPSCKLTEGLPLSSLYGATSIIDRHMTLSPTKAHNCFLYPYMGL